MNVYRFTFFIKNYYYYYKLLKIYYKMTEFTLQTARGPKGKVEN